jgi:sugar lactone lactonase YvrE
MYGPKVLSVDMEGNVETVAEVAQQPSGLGFLPDGTLLVVSMVDKRLLAIKDGEQRVVADLSEFAGGNCNDMVVDAQGRAYVGNFGKSENGPPIAVMVRVDPDGTMTPVAEDLVFPNGTVISDDGRTLVVAETFASRLSAFDVADDGSLSNRRVWAQLDGAFPDGICLDAEGAIWVANPGGNRLLRVLEGGRIEREITTGQRTFACMLGGPERKTLFVCTCTGSGEDAAQKTDGRIEVVDVDVPGAGLP